MLVYRYVVLNFDLKGIICALGRVCLLETLAAPQPHTHTSLLLCIGCSVVPLVLACVSAIEEENMRQHCFGTGDLIS